MGMLIIGIVLSLIGIGFYVFEPAWIASSVGAGGAFIGAGVAMIAIILRSLQIRKKRGVIEDERDYRIAEKASHKALTIIIILEGVLLAGIGVTESNIQAQPVVSLLFAVTMLTYVGFYYWYKRQM
ncbi:Protein of unknown function DUF2178, transmembrane [Methanohalobium evestigatum Z-7303]|uniref:DUF2178 domain-containing protein n=2 Tax=Methanohalobium evestigatum TaxID=2322 RepID=D7E7A1_METEZ|nr:Protein of unknown function DUF2178, transmembrane [Methanohalobium evestigatum Z-7303]